MPGLLGLFEDVAHARGPDTHKQLNEFRGGGLDEGHTSLTFALSSRQEATIRNPTPREASTKACFDLSESADPGRSKGERAREYRCQCVFPWVR